MTPVAAILDGVGLSQREAADFLGVRPDTVASWSRSRNPNRCPDGVLAELHALAERQRVAATAIVESYREAATGAMARGDERPTMIHVADLDDAGAAAIGWPCAGAYRAVLRRAWEMLPDGVRVELASPGQPAVKAARQARGFTGR